MERKSEGKEIPTRGLSTFKNKRRSQEEVPLIPRRLSVWCLSVGEVSFDRDSP